jgi:hypothetical protein
MVTAIVDQIAVERDRFERFCRTLNDAELNRPVPESGWQVRDFIAHLATIDRPVRRWFEVIQAGDPNDAEGNPGEGWNVDRFNDDAVAARRDQAVDALLAEAAVERSALVETLSRFTEEQLESSIRFGGDSKRPPMDLHLIRYLRGWARHDIIHVTDMLKALPERRADPLLVEWQAEPGVQTLLAMYQRAMR